MHSAKDRSSPVSVVTRMESAAIPETPASPCWTREGLHGSTAELRIVPREDCSHTVSRPDLVRIKTSIAFSLTSTTCSSAGPDRRAECVRTTTVLATHSLATSQGP
eukprot:scaffold4991_cov417-Prasinococcus_capsulatus_cf.AAC.7